MYKVIQNFLCYFFYFSPSLSTPRGRPWRTSSWSLLTPAPRWVMDASKLPRTKWPSWDPSKRMLPRQNPLHKYFPIDFTKKSYYFFRENLAAFFSHLKSNCYRKYTMIIPKKEFFLLFLFQICIQNYLVQQISDLQIGKLFFKIKDKFILEKRIF